MRISDWSSDVCSSDLTPAPRRNHSIHLPKVRQAPGGIDGCGQLLSNAQRPARHGQGAGPGPGPGRPGRQVFPLLGRQARPAGKNRSEEHTSELQSLMRISYAVFCLKKKKTKNMMSTYRYCR